MVPRFEKYTQDRSLKDPKPTVDDWLQRLSIWLEEGRQLEDAVQVVTLDCMGKQVPMNNCRRSNSSYRRVQGSGHRGSRLDLGKSW